MRIMAHRPRYHPHPVAFSAPLAVRLSHEAGWECYAKELGPFQVNRFNFVLRHRPLSEYGFGDAVEHVTSTLGTEMSSTEKFLHEFEHVDSRSILREQLETSGFTSSSKLNFDPTLAGVGGLALAASLEKSLAKSFKESRTVESSARSRKVTEREVNVKFLGGSEPSVHTVPYQRWELSVQLSHIDFLKVVYKPTHAGLRVRRFKDPELKEGRSSHSNLHISGLELGSFYYWVPVGGASTTLVGRAKYDDERINPVHIDFSPSLNGVPPIYDLKLFKATPTLYQISNAAFPLKARQRREAWTDEDLLMLLDEEPGNTAWIWERRRILRKRRLGF